MIKKLLYVLTVIAMVTTAGMGAAVDDICNKRPQVQLAFSKDLSDSLKWTVDYKPNRIAACNAAISSHVEKLGCKELYPFNFDSIFSLKRNPTTNLYELLFIQIQQSARYQRFDFSHSQPDCHLLSWSYIRSILDDKLHNKMMNSKEFADSIYTDIGKVGIQNAIIRLGCVVTDDYTAHFYNVFDTPQEQAKGAALLKELEQIMN